jgi:hypothetical protein
MLKYVYKLSWLITLIVVVGCNKKNSSSAQPTSVTQTPITVSNITVTAIPEQIGYKRVFKITPIYVTSTVGSTLVPTQTLLPSYTCTYNCIADTFLPNAITGKLYTISFSNGDATRRAFSYTNPLDSTWYFTALNFSNVIKHYSLKLPLVVSKTWNMPIPNNTTANYHLTCASRDTIQVLNTATQCFFVGCIEGGSNGMYEVSYYYINNKGLVKWEAEYYNSTNNSFSQTTTYLAELLSINY